MVFVARSFFPQAARLGQVQAGALDRYTVAFLTLA
jgi:hypothetical protein